jgi:hypothetical protein
MTPQQLEQTLRDEPRLAVLVERFHRAVDLQTRRDAATVASLTRVLRNPRSADAERLVELLRSIAREELETRTCTK